MDINDLGREELVDLVRIIGDRLSQSIEAECLKEIEIKGLEREIAEARDGDQDEGGLAEVAALEELIKTREECRASAELFRTNERRLERELRECRATVMNEISAMIPKAVEAEREAILTCLRDTALKCDTAAQANILMGVVNMVKLRGSEGEPKERGAGR
jgi:glutamine synthetase adenylyltransferase